MLVEVDMDENENCLGCDDKNESIWRSVLKDYKVMVFFFGIDLDRYEVCLVYLSISWFVFKLNVVDVRKF